MLAHLLGASLGTLVVLTATAGSEPRDPPASITPWSVTALVGTGATVDLAAGLQLELPARLRVTATVGWMPHAYAWAFKKYYEGVYDGRDAVGDVVEDLLSGAFVARANVGYRPLAHRGLFATVGYALQTSSKNALVASAFEAATGRALPSADPVNPRRFETSIRAHLLDATLGWQWGIGSGFTLSASVGVLVIVSTSTRFDPLFTPADPSLTAAFVAAAEELLEDAGTGIVAPQGTLYLGYTF